MTQAAGWGMRPNTGACLQSTVIYNHKQYDPKTAICWKYSQREMNAFGLLLQVSVYLKKKRPALKRKNMGKHRQSQQHTQNERHSEVSLLN